MSNIAQQPLTIITGGSRGIGSFLVEMFLQDGDVLNISRESARTEHSPGVLHNISLDLQDVESIEPTLGAWLDRHPQYEVKVLIPNAATLCLGRLDEASVLDFEKAFRINVYAPVAMTSAIYRMKRFASSNVRVAYVVSSLGRPEVGLSFAGLGLYSATKAALGRLALIQRREFELSAPHIEVMRIHPGVVDTDIQSELRHDSRLDPAFADKTSGLPRFQDGDWDGRSPKDNMRTISAEFSAEFVYWVVRWAIVNSDEYDFYDAHEFHLSRASALVP